MFPLKPIRLALSIAVRTLFIAPAAAILALSVIERACRINSAFEPCASNQDCNQQVGQNCSFKRAPSLVFEAAGEALLMYSQVLRMPAFCSKACKRILCKPVTAVTAHPWIFPACRLRDMPAVPIGILEGWRRNSVVEGASLIALLCSDVTKPVLCESYGNVTIIRACCTRPAARHHTIGLDLRRCYGEGVIHRLSLTLFCCWECMCCRAVSGLQVVRCAARGLSRGIRLYCELNVASVLRIHNRMSTVERVQAPRQRLEVLPVQSGPANGRSLRLLAQQLRARRFQDP